MGPYRLPHLPDEKTLPEHREHFWQRPPGKWWLLICFIAICFLTVIDGMAFVDIPEVLPAVVILPILGVTFAALCLWLTVRIVNRRERWAKWMFAAVVGLPVLYVATFGPMCWIFSRITRSQTPRGISLLYYPMIWVWFDGQTPISKMIGWYAHLGAAVRLDAGRATNGGAYSVFKP